MQILTHTIRGLLLLILVGTPWLFGGVWPSVQWILMFVVAVLLGFDLVTRFGDEDRPPLIPSAWLPLLLGIALGLFQLVNWPVEWAQYAAPGTLRWRQELTAELPPTDTRSGPEAAATAAAEPTAPAATEPSAALTAAPAAAATATETTTPRRVCRSLYPTATREYLALLAVAMSVFVLASVHLVDRQSVVWFFCALGGCGAALSFFGLVQRLSWNGKFYWLFEPINGSVQSFGPFVNRNNAGGFLNLCLAAGIGWLVWVHRDHSWFAQETPRERRRSGASRVRSSSTDERRATPDSTRTTSASRPAQTTTNGAASSHNTTDGGRSDATDTASSTTDAPLVNDRQPPPAASNETSGHASADELLSAYRMARNQSTADDAEAMPQRPATSGGREPFAAAAPSVGPSEPAPAGSPKSSRRESSGARGSSSGRSRERSRYSAVANPSSYGSSRSGRRMAAGVGAIYSNYFGSFNAARFAAVAIVGCTAGGVLCTASRGSIIAMFCAAIVAMLVLTVKQGNRGYAAGLLVMLVAGLALMSWSGQTEFVQSRFEELFDSDVAYESGRLPNWQEALNVWPEFPVAGTGLGTYRLVYERFQHRDVQESVHTHAENQFVQSIVEGGAIAFVLLLAEIALTACALVRLYRAGGAVNNALAIAGTYGLASQVVGGLFDFGLYIPSNTLLMATLCGIVIGRAALLSIWPSEALDSLDSPRNKSTYEAPSRRSSRDSTSRPLTDQSQTVEGASRLNHSESSRKSAIELSRSVLLALNTPTYVVTLTVGFLLLGCLFGSLEMHKASRIDAAVRNASLESLSLESRPEILAAKAAPIQTALPLRWDDAEAHRQLAELLVQQYRAAIYHDLVQETQSAAAEPTAAASNSTAAADSDNKRVAADKNQPPPLNNELWTRSSPHYLFGVLRDLEAQGHAAEANRLRANAHAQEFLVPAGRHLLLAREIAPTVPQVHYLLAELSAVLPVLGDDNTHLQRSHLLAPGDAELWYWSGVLDLNAHRKDAACADWNQSLTISPRYLDSVMQTVRGRLTGRQLLEQVLPHQADLLLFVAQHYFNGEKQQRLRDEVLKYAESALPDTKLPPAEFAYVAATIANLRGQYEAAAKYYEQAISARATALNWRHEFAIMLIADKRFEDAIEQASYLVKVAPKNTTYESLLRQAISENNRKDLPKQQ